MRRSFFHPQQPAQTKGWATYKGKIDGLHTWEINGQTYKSSVSTVGASPQVGVQYPALCKQPNSSSQWVALTGRPKEFLIPYQGGAPASTYLWATALGKPGGLYNVDSQGGTDFKDGEQAHGLQGFCYRTTSTHLIACNGVKFYRYGSLDSVADEFSLGEEFNDYIPSFSLTVDGRILAYLSSGQKIACYEWGNKIPLWVYAPSGGRIPGAGDAVEFGDKIYVPLRDSGDRLQYSCLSSSGAVQWESSIEWKSRIEELPKASLRSKYFSLTNNVYDDYKAGHQQDRSQSSAVILGEIAQTTTQLVPRARGSEYVPVINKATGALAWSLKGWDEPDEEGYLYLELYSLACTYGDLSLFFVTRVGWYRSPTWKMPIVNWQATRYAIAESDMEFLDDSATAENFSSLSMIFGQVNDPSRNPSFTIHWPSDPSGYVLDGLAAVAESIESNTTTDTVDAFWNFVSARHEYRSYDQAGTKVGSCLPTDQEKIVDGTKKISKYKCPKGSPLGYIKETWHYTRDKPNPYRVDDSDPFTWTSLSQDWALEDHEDADPLPAGKMPAVQYVIARQKGAMVMPNYDAILPGTDTSAPHHRVPGTQRPDGRWTGEGAIFIMAPYKSGTRTVEVPMYSYGFPVRSETIYTDTQALLDSEFKVKQMKADMPYSTEGATVEIGIYADTDDDGSWDMDVEYPKDKPDIDCRFLAEEVWVTAYTYYYDYVEIPIEVDAWPPYNPVDGSIIDGRLVFPPGKANLKGTSDVGVG